jgi:hypothetical protein
MKQAQYEMKHELTAFSTSWKKIVHPKNDTIFRMQAFTNQ